jgi:hypothetical protein
MSRFATADHLIAWSGMCPGQNKIWQAQTQAAARAPWLKTMLVQ